MAPSDSRPQGDVTQLLQNWSDGSKEALDQLMPVVLDELRRQAQGYMSRERPSHTLEPSALVNEVYLRLVDQNRARWRDRVHFFAVAAQIMRRILVDHARAHQADKRGGWAQKVELDEAADIYEEQRVDLVSLDEALVELGALDERQARVVELRFFAGLTIRETAEVLGITHATVSRDWKSAKAWLYRRIRKR
ncbi:MAG: sigma-70 family RNA polymerase sigma factor [bacterium]|nr:sigma-70 family RNA polymerase sigma factor [bacterium]